MYLNFLQYLDSRDASELKDRRRPISEASIRDHLNIAEKQLDQLIAKYDNQPHENNFKLEAERLQLECDTFRSCVFGVQPVYADNGIGYRHDHNFDKDGKTQRIETPMFVRSSFSDYTKSVFLYNYRRYFLNPLYKPSMVMKSNVMNLFPILFSAQENEMDSYYSKITPIQNAHHDYLGCKRILLEEFLVPDVTNIVFQYLWTPPAFTHGLITELRTILLYLCFIMRQLCIFYDVGVRVSLMESATNLHDLQLVCDGTNSVVRLTCHDHLIFLANDPVFFCDGTNCPKNCSYISRTLETSLDQFTKNTEVPLCQLMGTYYEMDDDPQFGQNLAMLLFGWGELSGYDWAYHVFMRILEKKYGTGAWRADFQKDVLWENTMAFIDSLFGKSEKNRGRKRKEIEKGVMKIVGVDIFL